MKVEIEWDKIIEVGGVRFESFVWIWFLFDRKTKLLGILSKVRVVIICVFLESGNKNGNEEVRWGVVGFLGDRMIWGGWKDRGIFGK